MRCSAKKSFGEPMGVRSWTTGFVQVRGVTATDSPSYIRQQSNSLLIWTPGLADMNQRLPNDPLHGITLAMILERLVAHAGWAELGRVIPVRCFTHDPSINSSLTFLRKTPWARAKVEAFYLNCLDEIGPTSDKSNEGSAI